MRRAAVASDDEECGARVILLNIDAFWIGLNVRLVVVHDRVAASPALGRARAASRPRLHDARRRRSRARAVARDRVHARPRARSRRSARRAARSSAIASRASGSTITSPPSSTPTRASSSRFSRRSRTTRSAVGSSPSRRAPRRPPPPPRGTRGRRTPSTASVASRSSNRASSSSAAPSTPRRRRGSRTKPSASATLPAMITKTRRRPTNARRGVALNPTRRVKRVAAEGSTTSSRRMTRRPRRCCA